VSALLVRTRIETREEDDRPALRLPRSALSWFHCPPSTQLGIYSTVFSSENQEGYLEELKQMQLNAQATKLWTMLMIAGGHFAAIVVRFRHTDRDLAHESKPKNHSGKSKARTGVQYEIVQHKTFHRYTSTFMAWLLLGGSFRTY
jgi:hypothetical protein